MKIIMSTGLQIKSILGNDVSTKMPVKVAYKIMKILSSIEKEEEFFNSKMREIIDEYGKKDEQGNPVFTESGGVEIKEGVEGECNQKVAELNSLEIEISDLKLTLDELDGIELTPREIYALDPIIEN